MNKYSLAALAVLLPAPLLAQSADLTSCKARYQLEENPLIALLREDAAEKRAVAERRERESALSSKLSGVELPNFDAVALPEAPADEGGERSFTVKAGVAGFDDGGKSLKVDAFYRKVVYSRAEGELGLSGGLGWTGRRDEDSAEFDSQGVELEDGRRGRGHRHHGNGHGFGHLRHDDGDDSTATAAYAKTETRLRSELFELVRADYATPELCRGVKVYGGAGAGVGTLQTRTKTSTLASTTTDGGSDCDRETRTAATASSAASNDRKWAPFWTAFVGCKVDGRKALGIPCDITAECEKIFAGDLKSSAVAGTLGFGWDF